MKPSMTKVAPEVETSPVEPMERTATPQKSSQPTAPTQQPNHERLAAEVQAANDALAAAEAAVAATEASGDADAVAAAQQALADAQAAAKAAADALRLDIKISLSVHNIYEIRETEQTFRAKFFYMLSWEARDDPKFNEYLGGKYVNIFHGDGRHPHIRSGDESSENEKVVGCDGNIDTSGQEIRAVLRTLRWTNSVGPIVEEPVPAACCRIGKTLRYAAHVEGCFSEPLELKNFPFDRQSLHIFLEGNKNYKMKFHNADKGKKTRATRFSSRFKGDVNVKKNSEGEVIQEAWEVPRPTNDDEKEEQRAGLLSQWQFSDEILLSPYESEGGESASGISYAGAQFTMLGVRKSKYLFKRVVLPSFITTCLLATQWAIGVSETGDRLALNATVLLALGVLYGSAYDSIPKVSYHNLLTVYLLGCQFLALIVSFEAAIVGWGWGVYGDVEEDVSIEDSRRDFDMISGFVVGGVWLLWHLYFYCKWWSIADDNKRVRGLFEDACKAAPDKDPSTVQEASESK